MDPAVIRKQTRSPENLGNMEEGFKGYQKREREGRRNMREQDFHKGERAVRESKKRNILIEGTSKGFARNMAPWKFSGIYKDDPS